MAGATKGESGKKLQRRLCDYHRSKMQQMGSMIVTHKTQLTKSRVDVVED